MKTVDSLYTLSVYLETINSCNDYNYKDNQTQMFFRASFINEASKNNIMNALGSGKQIV